MNYDSETKNGIPYFAALYQRNYKYKTVINELDTLAPTRDKALTTGSVTNYTIGNRSISRGVLSAADVIKRWDKLMAEKIRLEAGKAPRKSVGVLFRDW